MDLKLLAGSGRLKLEFGLVWQMLNVSKLSTLSATATPSVRVGRTFFMSFPSDEEKKTRLTRCWPMQPVYNDISTGL